MSLLLLFANPSRIVGVVDLAHEEFSTRLKKNPTEVFTRVEGQPFIVTNAITLFDARRYSPAPSGGTMIYNGLLLDERGTALFLDDLSVFELSIINTVDGTPVNGVNKEDLLAGAPRITFRSDGVFKITITSDETALAAPETKKARSIILEWQYGAPTMIGRHQADFMVVRLAGD